MSKNLSESGEDHTTNTLILKDYRIYCHNIARINYTTYDVCQAQDVINPRTEHCNIMVLRHDNNVVHASHKFIYGKVLGIYHVNIIVIGVGMVDYTPC